MSTQPTPHASPLPPPQRVLVRYGELSLKGANRWQFEDLLCRNITAAVRRIAPTHIEKRQGRLVLIPNARVEAVARRMQHVFGIKSVSPVWCCAREPEAIAQLARAIVGDALEGFAPDAPVTFRVESRRADKSFSLSSRELDLLVAEHVIPHFDRLRVQLDDPALVLGIDVRKEQVYLFAQRFQGPGGLPVGSLGRALALISGGIDSPVAAWLAMKRGLLLSYVTFHSYPFIGDPSKRNVIELVRILARFQPASTLHVVPFAEIQTAVRDLAPENHRTLLYRRMMQRLAARLAARAGMIGLVTGESLGQVASQTLENIACIEQAADVTVLRPVIGFDKEDTIALARRIGTFETSSRQEPDCCSLFAPRAPVLRGQSDVCARIEARIDLEALLAHALERTETIAVEHD